MRTRKIEFDTVSSWVAEKQLYLSGTRNHICVVSDAYGLKLGFEQRQIRAREGNVVEGGLYTDLDLLILCRLGEVQYILSSRVEPISSAAKVWSLAFAQANDIAVEGPQGLQECTMGTQVVMANPGD